MQPGWTEETGNRKAGSDRVRKVALGDYDGLPCLQIGGYRGESDREFLDSAVSYDAVSKGPYCSA